MQASNCFQGLLGRVRRPPLSGRCAHPVTPSRWCLRVLHRATAFTKGSGPWAERYRGEGFRPRPFSFRSPDGGERRTRRQLNLGFLSGSFCKARGRVLLAWCRLCRRLRVRSPWCSLGCLRPEGPFWKVWPPGARTSHSAGMCTLSLAHLCPQEGGSRVKISPNLQSLA